MISTLCSSVGRFTDSPPNVRAALSVGRSVGLSVGRKLKHSAPQQAAKLSFNLYQLAAVLL